MFDAHHTPRARQPDEQLTPRSFPANFVFGAATAAYQIEGSAHEDGRTDSIWDVFCRLPGAVVAGDNGDTACDHYRRYRDDVSMMKTLGLQAYRFSTSWSRVQPDGGRLNPKGLDFYSRLVDELLEQDIAPWLTLYHWDLPQAIEEHGGWVNRDTAYRFRDYALAVHSALGDRANSWTTLNEPWCSSFLGYIGGEHAPGRHEPPAGLAAAHNLLLAHGLTASELASSDPAARLSIALNLALVDPVDPDDPDDQEAARRIDGQLNRFFLDPIFRGVYPADVLEDVAHLGFERHVQPGDLEIISAPIHSLGVNYYHGEMVSSRPAHAALSSAAPSTRPKRSPFPAADGVHWHGRGLPTTAMGWEVQPEGLSRLLRRVHEEYTGPAGIEVVITENGAAYDDSLTEGAIHDTPRVAFLQAHLAAVLDAVDAGVSVGGYFYWSLMDNFEWAWGYSQRFGIVRVDFDTQQRTLKDSALAYARIIAARSLPAN
ncbi:MAG: GH1 family beta-glucosidase [Rhodoglobus sp.]